MLRFLGKFQADFLLTNGWIEPLLVGGYAPFSPVVKIGLTKEERAFLVESGAVWANIAIFAAIRILTKRTKEWRL